MENINSTFSYVCYDDDRELPPEYGSLLQQARQATARAYAPYSQFYVGAALRLGNGVVMTGSNQENASFPAGLCAERVVLSAAAAQHPGVAVEMLAVSYDNKKGTSTHPVSPCGVCRQTLAEYEMSLKHPITLILGGLEGNIYVIPSASLLLPLGFSSGDMRG